MVKGLTSVLILAMVLIISSPVITSTLNSEEFMNFEKTRNKVIKLWRQGNYREAIKIYEKALPRFPDRANEITLALAELYLSLGEYEKCLDKFEYGLKRKIMYPLWLDADNLKPLEKYERFTKIVEENTRLQAEATAKSAPRLRVLPPDNYSKEKKYPLIMVLHGWNGSLEILDKQWESTMVRREFLLALVQSSQVIQVNRFGWNDIQLGRKDVKTIYKKIIETYPVDKQQVIIGGFSQGGTMALDIAINDIIPVKGFVVLQPGLNLSTDFNGKILERTLQQGLRGTIIASKTPKSLREQVKMTALSSEMHLPYRYIISGTGHWYPRDFLQQLDTALEDIFYPGTQGKKPK
jgi:tetratricopeptide (TPR) repeat protein